MLQLKLSPSASQASSSTVIEESSSNVYVPPYATGGVFVPDVAQPSKIGSPVYPVDGIPVVPSIQASSKFVSKNVAPVKFAPDKSAPVNLNC